MTRWWRVLRSGAMTLFGAMPLSAQSIIGTVVLADSSTSVASVIVSATDPSGATVARALTSGTGEFVLRLPGAGSYRVTVLRIGFRPTPGPLVTVGATSTERVRIVATGAGVNLAAMGVRERETCRVSADTGLMVARVWEEARKAMLTTQLTADSAPAMFAEWISYDRALEPAGAWFAPSA